MMKWQWIWTEIREIREKQVGSEERAVQKGVKEKRTVGCE